MDESLPKFIHTVYMTCCILFYILHRIIYYVSCVFAAPDITRYHTTQIISNDKWVTERLLTLWQIVLMHFIQEKGNESTHERNTDCVGFFSHLNIRYIRQTYIANIFPVCYIEFVGYSGVCLPCGWISTLLNVVEWDKMQMYEGFPNLLRASVAYIRQ